MTNRTAEDRLNDKANDQTRDLLIVEIVKATERGDRETADKLAAVLHTVLSQKGS